MVNTIVEYARFRLEFLSRNHIRINDSFLYNIMKHIPDHDLILSREISLFFAWSVLSGTSSFSRFQSKPVSQVYPTRLLLFSKIFNVLLSSFSDRF